MERAETSEGLEGLEFEGPTSTAAMTNASTDVAPDWPNITYHPYYQHSLPVAASFILSYFAIFLLCMVGNILVCFIVVENRRMRTVINLFILNLAISDLLVGIFCIPTTLVDNLITGQCPCHPCPQTYVALFCLQYDGRQMQGTAEREL